MIKLAIISLTLFGISTISASAKTMSYDEVFEALLGEVELCAKIQVEENRALLSGRETRETSAPDSLVRETDHYAADSATMISTVEIAQTGDDTPYICIADTIFRQGAELRTQLTLRYVAWAKAMSTKFGHTIIPCDICGNIPGGVATCIDRAPFYISFAQSEPGQNFRLGTSRTTIGDPLLECETQGGSNAS